MSPETSTYLMCIVGGLIFTSMIIFTYIYAPSNVFITFLPWGIAGIAAACFYLIRARIGFKRIERGLNPW